MALTHAAYLLWVGAREPSFLFWHGPFVSDERWPEAAIRLLSGACSSGFFILMGAGISLYAHARREAGWNWPAIRRHFAIRGLVLMVLQFGVENMLWSLKP
ncbi:MAG: hypothetical protein J0L84_14860, partial [Verrucomicrobia bacterium]|nr:hypothetical protein [Verrucomicrobiota bacterium]